MLGDHWFRCCALPSAAQVRGSILTGSIVTRQNMTSAPDGQRLSDKLTDLVNDVTPVVTKIQVRLVPRDISSVPVLVDLLSSSEPVRREVPGQSEQTGLFIDGDIST